MARYLLSPILILLPLIALFSGMALTPVLILYALTAAIYAGRALTAWPSQERLATQYILAILALPLLSALWSLTPEHSLSTALSVATLCLIGLVAWHGTASLPTLSPKVIYGVSIALALAGLILILERILPHGLIYSIQLALHKDYDRFMLKNINRGLCALTVLVWPLMLGLRQQQKNLHAWIMFALLFVAVMLMHSLSAKLGILAGLVAFLMLNYWPRFTARTIAVGLPLLFLALVPLFLLAQNTLFQDEAFFANLTAQLPQSSMQRLGIWHVLLHYAEEHWLLGWGMDTTRALPMTPEELTALGFTEPPLHPHLPAMQVLVEQGVAGMLLAAGGLYMLLRQWLRMDAGLAKATLGAIAVTYFFSGLSSFGIWQSWWIATLWLVLMLWRWVAKRQ